MTTDPTAAAVDELLTDARVWGLELETGFRVLAATVEVEVGRHPDGPTVDDPRLQVLFHPVARVAALLTRQEPGGPVTIERFGEAQLPLVVDRFDGPVPSRVVLDGRPDPSGWAPELSLEGASSAPDGRSHALELALEGPGGRHLRLAVWFDEIELRRPDGTVIGPSGPVGPLGLG
ncbi:MAG: hypothetical protein KY457_11995 [Actinobacteria bacterium]|nr:hypothetical protein [Actinomycetota bacterium]